MEDRRCTHMTANTARESAAKASPVEGWDKGDEDAAAGAGDAAEGDDVDTWSHLSRPMAVLASSKQRTAEHSPLQQAGPYS